MDPKVVMQIGEMEINTETDLPRIGILTNEQGAIDRVGDTVCAIVDGKPISLHVEKISKLFAGTKKPPSFRHGPTEEYMPFFAIIEVIVLDYCSFVGRAEYDVELERLYNHLRRRPDGQDANPLFSYMQAAARLYMSLFNVSQAEFDAVCRRLARSADHFRIGPTSTNYYEIVGANLESLMSFPLLEHPRGREIG